MLCEFRPMMNRSRPGMCAVIGFRASQIFALGVVLAAGGCHLVDQQDFWARAGSKPVKFAPPVGALMTIDFTDAVPSYGEALAQNVAKAMAIKPDVVFLVEASSASTESAEKAVKDGQEVAEAIEAAGASPRQVEQSLKVAQGDSVDRVRIRIR